MKTILSILCCFSLTSALYAQDTLAISELNFLDNTSWEGTLMYKNYGDGKEVILRTTMQIEIKGDKIIMHRQFTDEPSANSRTVFKLEEGGTYFGEEAIVNRTESKDGILEIVTEFMGKDNNEPATIFKTYRIGNKEFSVTQEVQLDSAANRFVRNRMTYTRSK